MIAPTVSIFCAYAEDGNSMDGSKVCNPLGGNGVTCIPGCYPKGQECPDIGHAWSCSFPPTQLKEALQAQQDRSDMRARNNEVCVCAARNALSRHSRESSAYASAVNADAGLTPTFVCTRVRQIVIDTSTLVAQMPEVILGFFYIR